MSWSPLQFGTMAEPVEGVAARSTGLDEERHARSDLFARAVHALLDGIDRRSQLHAGVRVRPAANLHEVISRPQIVRERGELALDLARELAQQQRSLGRRHAV